LDIEIIGLSTAIFWFELRPLRLKPDDWRTRTSQISCIQRQWGCIGCNSLLADKDYRMGLSEKLLIGCMVPYPKPCHVCPL